MSNEIDVCDNYGYGSFKTKNWAAKLVKNFSVVNDYYVLKSM